MSHELETSLAIHCYTAFQKIMNSVFDPLLFDEIPSPYQQKWFAFARSILNRYHVDLSLTKMSERKINKCTNCSKEYQDSQAVFLDIEQLPFGIRSLFFNQNQTIQFCTESCKIEFLKSKLTELWFQQNLLSKFIYPKPLFNLLEKEEGNPLQAVMMDLRYIQFINRKNLKLSKKIEKMLNKKIYPIYHEILSWKKIIKHQSPFEYYLKEEMEAVEE